MEALSERDIFRRRKSLPIENRSAHWFLSLADAREKMEDVESATMKNDGTERPHEWPLYGTSMPRAGGFLLTRSRNSRRFLTLYTEQN